MATLGTSPHLTSTTDATPPLDSPSATVAELIQRLRSLDLSQNPLVMEAVNQVIRSQSHQRREGAARVLDEHIFPVTLAVIERAILTGKKVTPELVAGTLLHDVPEDDPRMPLPRFRQHFQSLVQHSSDGKTDMTATVAALTEPDWRSFPGCSDVEKRAAQMLAYSEQVIAGGEDAIFIKIMDRENNILCSHKLHDVREIPMYCDDTERWILPLARIHAPAAAIVIEERIAILRAKFPTPTDAWSRI